MKPATQTSLFEESWEEKFRKWKDTPEGGKAMHRIIKVSMALRKSHKQFSIRDIIAFENVRRFTQPNRYSEGFAVNNNFISHMARYIEARHPELKDFYTKRKQPVPQEIEL